MNIGDYVRTEDGTITRIKMFYEKKWKEPELIYARFLCEDYEIYEYPRQAKSSPNIIDLVEYMDLLWLEHPIKLYDSDTTIGLFNPVRCDGFTTFEDGTHCIILNLDYIVDIKDLKIKGIITHEQIESMEYKVKE